MSAVTDLEAQLKAAKNTGDLHASLMRLQSNKDFRKIIMEGFCQEECARYIVMAGDSELEQNERNDALNMAMAAGHLQRYLKLQERKYEHGPDLIQNLQVELERARREESSGEMEDGE